jgi:hypothetical protein
MSLYTRFELFFADNPYEGYQWSVCFEGLSWFYFWKVSIVTFSGDILKWKKLCFEIN